MQDRRKPPHLVTPDYEDRGIFRKPPRSLTVELVPRIARNARGDVLIRGLVTKDTAVHVVFAGRRMKKTEPLIRTLQRLWTQANRRASAVDDPPEFDAVRLPVLVDGTWRAQFQRDHQGWETRTYQLLAARWSFNDGHRSLAFGEPPIRAGR